MSDKERKGQYLLGELGGIDDDLLYEAVTLYPAERRKRKHNRIIALICAAAAVMMLMAPIGTVGTIFFTLSEFINMGNDKFGSVDPPTAEPSVQQFYGHEMHTDLFFGGKPLIIWQNQGESFYHVMSLDSNEFYAINDLMAESSRRQDDTSSIDQKIWICDGNGFVKTPYLEDTPGNVYYATLFDYDPELVLTEELEARLEELTS